MTLESWNDPENRRFIQRVVDAGPETVPRLDGNKDQPSTRLLAELHSIFRQNGYNVENPLSSENQERWRESLKGSSDEVVESALPAGDAALVVKTGAAGPYSAHSIIQAELVVRTGDWHPVEQRLRVQGKEHVLDYEITERTFEVVTLTALPPTLFTEVAPPLPATLTSTQPALPAAVLSSEAELLAREIQAHYALHQLKACLGKPIHVSRNAAGRIEVGGLVETAEERDELKAALRTVPGAVLKVQTLAEAMQAAASGSPASTGAPTASSEAYSVTVRSGRMPLQLQLQEYFGKSGVPETGDPVASLSNGAVTLSRSIMVEAWALRRLAERYKGNRTDSLPPYARFLLQNMVQDHVSSLRLAVEKARHLLEPVLSSLFPEEFASKGGLGNLADSGKPWTHTCLELFDRAEEVRVMADVLFAGAETVVRPEILAGRLVELLSRWTRQFPSMEVVIAGQLSADLPDLAQRARQSAGPDSNASRP